MDARNVKLPERRYKVSDNKSLGIQNYGENNLYPLELRRIVSASSTGASCLRRYAKFILGDGFTDEKLAQTVCNAKGQTFDDVLELADYDLAENWGVALHVNYNIDGKAVELQHIPFENTRLGLADSEGNVDKIAVFPDWSGSTYFDGKLMKPKKDTITWINRFNPTKVLDEIPETGIGDYNGQIIWFSNTGMNSYPVAKYDSGITEISTDEGLANIAYRTVRSGFFSAGALITKKGLNTGSDEQNGNRPMEQNDLVTKIERLQGDENLNKMIAFELDFDEEEPKFIKFGGENYDKEFSVTNANTVERIYAVFEQEPFYRIRNGSIGFNSEMIAQVYEYYSSVTGTERRQLERIFKKVLLHWHDETISTNTTISPLKYINNESQYNQYSGYSQLGTTNVSTIG